MMYHRVPGSKTGRIFLNCLVVAAVCLLLAACTVNLTPGGSTTSQCQSNCTAGSGVQGVQVYVEPDDGEQVIINAIRGAQKSIWKHNNEIGGRKITHLSLCANGEMLLVLDGDTATILVARLKE